MTVVTDQMVIEQRLVGAEQLIASLEAEVAAMKQLAVASDEAAVAQTRSQKKSFLLMQTLFTARRVMYGFSLAVGAAAVGLVTMGFKFDAMMQSSQLAFSGLLHSSSLAKQELDLLFQTAAHSPFLFQNLTQSARLLLAFGMNLKQTNAVVMSSANALAYFGKTGADLENVSATFGKIYQSGYLMMRQVRQLVVAGIPVFPALRKELHLTDLQVQQFMAGKLKIPSDIGIQALLNYMNKNFGDGMQRFSKTWTGRWTTLKDYTQMLMGQLLQGPFNAFLAKIGNINDALSQLMDTAKHKGFTAMLQQLDGMLGANGGLVLGIGIVVDAFKAWWNWMKVIQPVLWQVITALVWMFLPVYLLAKAFIWAQQYALIPLKYILYPIIGLFVAYRIILLYVRGATLLWAAATKIAEGVSWLLTTAVWAAYAAQWYLNIARKDGIAYALYSIAVDIGLVGAYEAVTAAALGAASATWAFTIALLSNPITWIVVGVIALIAVFTILMIKFKGFRDFMLHYGGIIMLFIPGLQIVGTVLLVIGYFDKLKAAMWALVNFVKSHWIDIILFLTTFGAGNILYHFWDPIVNGLSDAVGWMKGVFVNFFNWIKQHGQDAMDPRNWIPFGLGSLVGGKGHVGFGWSDIFKLALPGPFSGLFAEGGVTSQRGYAVVGESGPELVWLPGGANVRPLAPVSNAGLQQLPAPGRSGPGQLTVHVPLSLDSGILANATAKVMLDQMARA